MTPRAASFRLLGALLLAGASLLGGCKPGASSQPAGAGEQNAVFIGPPLFAQTGPQRRTDRPPTLAYLEEVKARAERIFESRMPSGEMLRFREVLHSDGLGHVRVDVTAVWDAATETWIPPHPLLEGLYAQRTSFLVKLRDLHLHARGLLANYRWEPQPGTVTVDGRDCVTTRAHSLHQRGPIDLVHEVGSGLLLGWTVWDAGGTQVLQRLTTLDFESDPNQSGVAWVDDRLPEETYDPNVHPAELGFVPRPLDPAPAGFYREKAVVEDLRGHVAPVDHVYLEYWNDGLRPLFVMQHELIDGSNGSEGLNVARMSREGGVVAVESDATDRHVAAVGLLPVDDVLMVVGALYE